MFCPKCGTSLIDGAKTCPKCGTAVGSSGNASPSAGGAGSAQMSSLTKSVLMGLGIGACVMAVIGGGVFFLTKGKNVGETAGSDTSAVVMENTAEDAVNDSEQIAQDEQAVEQETAAEVSPEQAQAALEDISMDMKDYLWTVFIENAQDRLSAVGDSIDVDLTDAEKIRASVLASESDGKLDAIFKESGGILVMDNTASMGPDGDGYHGLSVSKESVEQNEQNLFGEDADWDKLQTAAKCYFFDAAKFADSGATYALRISSESESEADLEIHESRLEEDGNGFLGKVDLFWDIGACCRAARDFQITRLPIVWSRTKNQNTGWLLRQSM